ncbi:porin [Aureimonas frigidaquae]|uniref:porin n=1 Tax=Aureimonas frigidaquae TaxID=424757 RepID=UPI00078040DC|nr:porin [Aureimonas frigidaquae]
MNIKSLLLGSAAALVAVSGARAADAIVTAEPEPAEYVRVCDVYGAGFFYIPGTESCLKVSGLVRYQLGFAGNEAFETSGVESGGGYAASSTVRGRVNFDAREETELGTLRGYVRLQGDTAAQNLGGTTGGNVSVDLAYLQLGGLTAGYYDSLWTSDIGGAEDGLLTDGDLAVGDKKANLISYTVAMDGFSGTLSVENPTFTRSAISTSRTTSSDVDVVAKLAYSAGWGGAYVAGVYDSQAQIYPFVTAPTDAGYAIKAGAWVKNVGLSDSTLKVEGHFAPEKTDYATLNTGTLRALPLKWTAGVGYDVGFGKLGVAAAAQYGQTFDDYVRVGGEPANVLNLVGDVSYKVTTNLKVLTEVSYRNIERPALSSPDVAKVTSDQVNGFLRLERSF